MMRPFPLTMIIAITAGCSARKGDNDDAKKPPPSQDGETPSLPAVPYGISESAAKLLDPVLFGEWHDLTKTALGSSTHGVATWVLGKNKDRYVLERRAYGSDHIKYLVQTNTAVSPHQLTLTVTNDYNSKVVAGTKQLCLYNIEISETESLTGELLARYRHLVSTPRRTLMLTCSTLGASAFPASIDSAAQRFENIDDGFSDLNSSSSTHSSGEFEFKFDATSDLRRPREWDKTALIEDVRIVINYKGKVVPSGTQVYLVHEDGTKLLVHDKLAMDAAKYYRTIGLGGYPLDIKPWKGKALGDLSNYKLRISGYTTDDVELFRVGLYPSTALEQ